jgi:type I restriction enzyme M protein
MALGPERREWFFGRIEAADVQHHVVTVDDSRTRIRYDSAIRSDENRDREATDEELVRALTLCLLASDAYEYPVKSFYIEKRYTIGHPSTSGAEVDLIIYDDDDLPFAMWEMKAPDEYDPDKEVALRHQLFATAPLLGEPRLLAYSTIYPRTPADISCLTIDYADYKTFDAWDAAGRPAT